MPPNCSHSWMEQRSHSIWKEEHLKIPFIAVGTNECRQIVNIVSKAKQLMKSIKWSKCVTPPDFLRSSYRLLQMIPRPDKNSVTSGAGPQSMEIFNWPKNLKNAIWLFGRATCIGTDLSTAFMLLKRAPLNWQMNLWKGNVICYDWKMLLCNWINRELLDEMTGESKNEFWQNLYCLA